MGGGTCNHGGFVREAGAVNVQKEEERDTRDLLSCIQGLAAGDGAGAVPHSDAAGPDAPNGASVEGVHHGGSGLLLLSASQYCLIVVVDETHHSCVTCTLDEEVGAGCTCALKKCQGCKIKDRRSIFLTF